MELTEVTFGEEEYDMIRDEVHMEHDYNTLEEVRVAGQSVEQHYEFETSEQMLKCDLDGAGMRDGGYCTLQTTNKVTEQGEAMKENGATSEYSMLWQN